MKAQIIEKDGFPEFAVITYADYEHFLELIEDEADARTVAVGILMIHALVVDGGGKATPSWLGLIP
jgi:hypothetical protein